MPGISASKIGIPFSKKGMNWSSYWTQLLTEAGDNLVAENDDILLTEQNITEE